MKQKSGYLNQNTWRLELSYLEIRRAVGILGFCLPLILLLGNYLIGHCDEVKDSISDYYYTIMGSVLVGVLCGVALFLFSYRGFNNWDRISSNLAAVFALGVAFFPTNISGNHCNVLCKPDDPWRNGIHFTSAALFFVTLACMSMFLFTKTNDRSSMTPEKICRNKIYIICGITMLAAIAGIGIFNISTDLHARLYPYKPTFWLEFIALWAFGFSWLIKGEFLLSDGSAAARMPQILVSVNGNPANQTVIKIVLMPGAAMVDHYHTLFDENFKVIKGKVDVWYGNTLATLVSGQSVIIPKNTTHRYLAGSEESIVTVTFDPGNTNFENAIKIIRGEQKGGDFNHFATADKNSLIFMAIIADLTDSNTVGVVKDRMSDIYNNFGEQIAQEKRRLLAKYLL